LKLVLATANPDKAVEIIAVMSMAGIELLPRPPEVSDVDETGVTLEENARLKARALTLATGLPALADDTGLEVAALDGGPGVFSSRYAGESATYEDNVAKLLEALHGRVASERAARFRTVAIATFPDMSEEIGEGIVEGSIALEARGTNGFGYDPIFVPDGSTGRTFAELRASEKHAISHRGQALRALAARLKTRM
jgi:XTP/dITP diphosphohydrolase